MFNLAPTIVILVMGLALVVIGGVITPGNVRTVTKFTLMTVGVIIFFTGIIAGVYDGAGKPISFPAKPGYYEFKMTEKNIDGVMGIIKIEYKDIVTKKFVVIPKGAISNSELLENPNSVISALEVVEKVKGYKKIILKP